MTTTKNLTGKASVLVREKWNLIARKENQVSDIREKALTIAISNALHLGIYNVADAIRSAKLFESFLRSGAVPDEPVLSNETVGEPKAPELDEAA